MRRPRFTLRWMMVTVAVVAVMIGVERMRRLRYKYLARAEMALHAEVTIGMELLVRKEFKTVTPLQSKKFQDNIDAARRSRLKYERAARYPWLPVPPDPPMPE